MPKKKVNKGSSAHKLEEFINKAKFDQSSVEPWERDVLACYFGLSRAQKMTQLSATVERRKLRK